MSLEILVLCTGNIGRSPLGAALLRRALSVELGVAEDELEAMGVVVRSAGTGAPLGHAASRRGVAFAASRGLDLAAHQACQLSASDVLQADVIYCMDAHQLDAVAALDCGAAAKAQLLAGEGTEIPDPHYESDDFFWRVAEQIENAVSDRIPELLDRIETDSDNAIST